MSGAIVVESSGRILAHRVRWARSFRERARGLIGTRPLEPGEALVIAPGSQVHTFRMRYPIDVVFCDKNWNIRHVVEAMRPNRVSKWVWRARFVVELPVGATGDDIKPGVRLVAR